MGVGRKKEKPDRRSAPPATTDTKAIRLLREEAEVLADRFHLETVAALRRYEDTKLQPQLLDGHVATLQDRPESLREGLRYTAKRSHGSVTRFIRAAIRSGVSALS